MIANKKVFFLGKTPSPSASDEVTSLRTSVFRRGAFLFTRKSIFPSKQRKKLHYQMVMQLFYQFSSSISSKTDCILFNSVPNSSHASSVSPFSCSLETACSNSSYQKTSEVIFNSFNKFSTLLV